MGPGMPGHEGFTLLLRLALLHCLRTIPSSTIVPNVPNTPGPGLSPHRSTTVAIGHVTFLTLAALSQVGEVRELIIPAKEGYGAGGFPAWYWLATVSSLADFCVQGYPTQRHPEFYARVSGDQVSGTFDP